MRLIDDKIGVFYTTKLLKNKFGVLYTKLWFAKGLDCDHYFDVGWEDKLLKDCIN